MIYVMNGGTKLFAAIGVTYPVGSTLTCTNGSSTLKATNTSGQWVFSIPKAGTWTVSCTDGTQTQSKSVTISAEGQSVNVNLAYEVVLVSSPFTNSQKSSSTNMPNRNVATNGSINLSGIKTLRITVSEAAVNGGSIRFFVDTNSQTDYSYNSSHISTSAYVAITGKGEKTLDVSGLSGTYYYGLSLITKADNASTTSATISRIVGEYE